jgi:hypothetical protein
VLQVFENSDGGIFRVDDVFITGMLAERANVTHRQVPFIIWRDINDDSKKTFLKKYCPRTRILQGEMGGNLFAVAAANYS